MKIIPLIMAGGAGTRLWPLSNEEKPKQFHDFTGNGTLFQNTIRRLKKLNPEEFCVVTSHKYKGLTEDALRAEGVNGTVLSEPEARNTAAAVLFGAQFVKKKYEDALMIVLPADHYIEDPDTFLTIIEDGLKAAQNNSLITLGIEPLYPETGYGYIEADNSEDNKVQDVLSFREKPDAKTAEKYIRSGNYYWNSGIYIWKNSTILNSFEKHMPDHYSKFKELNEFKENEFSSVTGKSWDTVKSIFSQIEKISIDYGILENETKRKVIPGSFGWADLGSWKSIDTALKKDQNDNTSPKRDLSSFYNSSNCTVFPDSKKVYVAGCDNITVIEGENEILILNKELSQDIKKIKECN